MDLVKNSEHATESHSAIKSSHPRHKEKHRCLISKESCRLYKQGVLQLEDELLKKRGVMSWTVGGLMGRLGRPIRVRFRDQIRSYLGVKEPSLYKERRYVIQGKQEL